MLKRSWCWTSRVRSRAVVGTVGRRFVGKIPIAGGIFSASDRLFVLLVVVALLFCHGAFGYAHQLPTSDSHAAHTTVAHQSGPDQGAGQAHSGGAYFAAFLALFFGTFLLLCGRVLASARLPAPVVEYRGRRAGIPYPPRGPTLPFLQVFRL